MSTKIKSSTVPFLKDEILVFVHDHFGEYYGFKKWSKIKYVELSQAYKKRVIVKTNNGELWTVPSKILRTVSDSIKHRYRSYSDGTVYDTWESIITLEYLQNSQLSTRVQYEK